MRLIVTANVLVLPITVLLTIPELSGLKQQELLYFSAMSNRLAVT